MSRAEIFRAVIAQENVTGAVRNAAHTVADTLQSPNGANQQYAIGLFSQTVMRNPTPENMELIELVRDLATIG